MTKKKSPKNKTLDTSIEDGALYLERCLKEQPSYDLATIKNKTICGDTLSIMDALPSSFVDLLIVDPPYNLSKNYHGNVFRESDATDYVSYTKMWLKKCMRLLKPTASLYVCCDWKTSLLIASVLGDYAPIKNRITWQREKGRGAKSNWKNGMEDIWFATRGDEYTFNLDAVKMRKAVVAPYRENGKPKDWNESDDGRFRDTCPSNFWNDISIPYWSMSENTAHPTQKPEKLLAKLILASSNEGDVVFDPFLGSGTTSVTAKKLNRCYCGIEQNPRYCIWAEQRLERASMDASIQGFSDGVFWERNTSSLQRKTK